MLTDRSTRSRRPPASNAMNSNLPSSLQASPDRDEIICFAHMQTSPKEAEPDSRPRASETGDQVARKEHTIDSSYVTGAKVPNLIADNAGASQNCGGIMMQPMYGKAKRGSKNLLANRQSPTQRIGGSRDSRRKSQN